MEQKWEHNIQITLSIYSWLWQKEPRTRQEGGSLLSQFCWENSVNVQKNETKVISLTTYSYQPKGNQDTWKAQICESCKHKREKHSQVLLWVKSFLEMTPTVQTTKTETEKWVPVNLESFSTTKDTIKIEEIGLVKECFHSIHDSMGSVVFTGGGKWLKRQIIQLIGQKKISANYTSDKQLH